ncbi:MAG: TVP38/TMEM64 family protein, partial [Verrucomicrobiales bacterium]
MNSRHLGAAIFLLVVAGIIIWAARFSNPQEIVRSTLLWISQLGPWAPVLFVFAYIIACLIFFPGVILTLGAGVLFGVVKGTILVAVGATLGACSAFAIARFLARDWVKEKFGSYSHFKAIDEAVAEKGWKVVGMIRLSPVFPFIPMNFLFGLTRIPFLHFAFATFFGLIPLSSMFVYLGK